MPFIDFLFSFRMAFVFVNFALFLFITVTINEGHLSVKFKCFNRQHLWCATYLADMA